MSVCCLHVTYHPHMVHTWSTHCLHDQYLISGTPNGDTHASSAHHPCGPWVIHTSSLWLLDHLYIVSVVPRDQGWHWGPHMSSEHHLHESLWSPMWSPLTQVIHRLSPWSPMWSPLAEAFIHYSHMHTDVVHTLSLWSLGCLHVIQMVPGDWGWHWRSHVLSAHHLHVISVVPAVVCIDRGHLQVVPVVTNVVPIDRGHPTLFPHACRCCLHIISMATYVVPIDRVHPQAVPIVPGVVPIDRSHLQVVPMVPDVVSIDRSHLHLVV